MQELLIIFGIMLLLFGGSRLPGIAAGLGGAVNSFKKALKGEEAADDRTLNADNTHGTKVPAATPSEANTKQG